MLINRKCYFSFCLYWKWPPTFTFYSFSCISLLFIFDWLTTLFFVSFTQTNSHLSLSLSIFLSLNVYLKDGKRMMQVCHIDYHGLGGSWLLIAALILSFHFNFLIFQIHFFESLIHALVWAGLRGSWLLIAALISLFHFHFLIFKFIFWKVDWLGRVLGAVGY